MKDIRFWFDTISPFAWLAFDQLPLALEGHSHRVRYTPVVFGAMLAHHGQLGPAEIAPKRDWTYRQVLWLGHRHGTELRMPASHPFNSLHLQRLAVACGRDGEPNRYQVERLFRHVWCSGLEAGDPQRLKALAEELAPPRAPDGDEVKAQLRAHTDEAIARGLFGVPTIEVDGRLFWGFDALPMLRAYLDGDRWFDGPDWESVRALPATVSRRRG